MRVKHGLEAFHGIDTGNGSAAGLTEVQVKHDQVQVSGHLHESHLNNKAHYSMADENQWKQVRKTNELK